MAKNIANLTGARTAGRAQGAPPKTNGGHAKVAKGLRLGRNSTPPGSHAYDLGERERRPAATIGATGRVPSEREEVAVPPSWSQLAIKRRTLRSLSRARRS